MTGAGTKKKTIGTIERIKNDDGKNERIIQKIEKLFNKSYRCEAQKIKGNHYLNMTNVEKEIWDLLRVNKNVVLHGAPGTGKTFLARSVAKKLGCTEDEIEVVQFHPSYDYTDFVEGLRPTQKNAGGNIGFGRQDGVFKEFCKRALAARFINGSDNFESVWDSLLKTLDENEFIEIPMFSNISKTFSIALNEHGDKLSVLKGAMNEGRNTDMSAPNFFSKDQIRTVYRGAKGSISGRGDTYRRAIINYLKTEFGLQDYVAGTPVPADEARPFIFIIDEINRGELGKIFGELFGAIEPSYRGEAGRVCTQYQNLVPADDVFKKGFFVPENVFVIGTMNDIDRSVESMDFAMRRRFAWVEISPEDNAAAMFSKKIPAQKEDALARMKSLNAAIAGRRSLGADYVIGPACFLPLSDENGDFEALWRHHIAGTLREYLRGDPERDEILDTLKKAYNLSNEA